MELTTEQEERIILKVIEHILNKMPEVIGNLMSQYAENNKIKTEFLGQHTEFKEHLDIVTKIIQLEESKELGQDYETILKNSVPKIKEQIKVKQSVNLDSISDKDKLDLNTSIDDSFGVL